MKRTDIIEKLKNQLVVSCQALPHEPLYMEDQTFMHLMAKAAVEAGAKGIRANSTRDILKIKETVDVPVIGIIKKDYDDSEIYITPTIDEIDQLVEVKTDIIAFDFTFRTRPSSQSLDDFVKLVKEKYPDQLFMADVSTFEEGVHAKQLGIDFVGTTLSGYTSYSTNVDGPDLNLIEKLVNEDILVIAEGKIHTPNDLREVIKRKPFCYVVGGAITRPLEITKRFISELK